MPNHIHVIACPCTPQGLGRAIGSARRRWASYINARGGWRGHLFDGWFAPVAMGEEHLMLAFRYLALNPVRARLAGRAEHWASSSTWAHLSGKDDPLANVAPIISRVKRFADFLATDPTDPDFAALRASESTGRPLGGAAFVADLERRLDRPMAKRTPGRKLGGMVVGEAGHAPTLQATPPAPAY